MRQRNKKHIERLITEHLTKERLTVKEISERVGVSTRTVYRHFEVLDDRLEEDFEKRYFIV